jgi:hypothetical protein
MCALGAVEGKMYKLWKNTPNLTDAVFAFFGTQKKAIEARDHTACPDGNHVNTQRNQQSSSFHLERRFTLFPFSFALAVVDDGSRDGQRSHW